MFLSKKELAERRIHRIVNGFKAVMLVFATTAFLMMLFIFNAC